MAFFRGSFKLESSPMRYLFTFTLLLISTACLAQSRLQWTVSERTPTAQANMLRAAATDASGNTYTIQNTQDATSFWLIDRFFAYDVHGNKRWEIVNDSCFSGCQAIYHLVVPVDNDGAIFLGGYDDSLMNRDFRLRRYNLDGTLRWQQDWAYPYMSVRPLIARFSPNGSLVVAMVNEVNPVDGDDFALAAFDTTNGTLLWDISIPDQGPVGVNLFETITDMEIDAAGTIICTGNGGNGLAAIIRNYYFSVSPAGSLNWIRFSNGNLIPSSTSRLELDGLGYFYRSHGQNGQLWLQKLDVATGSNVWSLPYTHDSASIAPVDLAFDGANPYLLFNYRYWIPDSSFSGGHWTNFDYSVYKYDTAGVSVFRRDYLSDLDSLAVQNGTGGAVQIGACGGDFYVLSRHALDSERTVLAINSFDTSGTVRWMDTTRMVMEPGGMTLDAECNVYLSRSDWLSGNYVTTVVQQFSDRLPTSLGEYGAETLNIFPNPTTGIIRVTGLFPDWMQVTDLSGREVYAIAHTDQLDLGALPEGIYLLRLQFGDRSHCSLVVKNGHRR
jgi:hypothetical protein